MFGFTLGCRHYTSEPNINFYGVARKNQQQQQTGPWSKEHFMYKNVLTQAEQNDYNVSQIWQHQPKINGCSNLIFTVLNDYCLFLSWTPGQYKISCMEPRWFFRDSDWEWGPQRTIYSIVRATKNRSQKEHKRRVVQALEALILEGGALDEEFTYRSLQCTHAIWKSTSESTCGLLFKIKIFFWVSLSTCSKSLKKILGFLPNVLVWTAYTIFLDAQEPVAI